MNIILSIVKIIVAFCIFIPNLNIGNTEDGPDIPKDRPVTLQEYLESLANFESVLNKKMMTLADFEYFYPCECSYGYEGSMEFEHCKNNLKVDPDSKECEDFMHKRHVNKNKSPSYFLTYRRNQITDNQNLPVKLFVDPGDIMECIYKDYSTAGHLEIDIIAKIGDKKYKQLLIEMPCSYIDFSGYGSKIFIQSIDGISISQYGKKR